MTKLKELFNSYKKYYNDLITSINLLLNKINNGDLVLRNDIYGNKDLILLGYKNIINKKQNKIKFITEQYKNNKNSKKGKTTLVLPYTDTLYVSIIYLLVIIDFLSYFYKPK